MCVCGQEQTRVRAGIGAGGRFISCCVLESTFPDTTRERRSDAQCRRGFKRLVRETETTCAREHTGVDRRIDIVRYTDRKRERERERERERNTKRARVGARVVRSVVSGKRKKVDLQQCGQQFV